MDEIQTEKKKSSKEMWLFLIFLDIVALCIFGFFIYNSFFSAAVRAEAAPFLEEVAVEDITIEAPLAAPKVQEKPVIKEQEKPVVKEQEKPVVKAEPLAKAEPKKEEAKPIAKPNTEAKKQQSVFVENIGKPTRSVTFKYYDKAASVSIIAGFTMKKPVKMRKVKGVWIANMRIFPGEYRYMLIVDGTEVPDPNAKLDDGKSMLIVK